MKTFYGRLNKASQIVIENSALMTKTFDEAVEILGNIAKKNCEWTVDDPSSSQMIIQQKITRVIETDDPS